MNIMKIHNDEDFVQTGANLVVSLLQSNPKAVLGLATGSSPIGVYERLIEMYRGGLVSFAKASSYNLDEYVGLPVDHPESYRSFMNKHLFSHVDIDLSRTHVPNGNAGDLEAECLAYDQMLENEGPVDLQILGIGSNGHIGFNEPDAGLNSGTHVVDLLPETREANARFFPSIADVPRQAITMGVGSILKARQILLLVRGAEKAEAIRNAVEGPITTQCPASLLQIHPNVVVLVDEGAGQWLK
ncbi:glucosamine-6-phosphate deaminase [Paenibacillus rhizophilus]|uniref:Glucosamine-6-phosphate deaminase n=1 Tax=Paenibacillus rhizophilus TaxID=1850366 RepID=A0A3N9PAL5_9BACL|nr:glucosamine-6-phosphate deaminase [Paenibacillus rhizophilus]RQW12367.1 glucosamine-6-phosphate deaminase [Paenibacillus rhizophilus]